MKVLLRAPKRRAVCRAVLLGTKHVKGVLDGIDGEFLERARGEGLFKGSAAEVCRVLLPKSAGAASLALVGLGDDEKIDAEAVRVAVGALARTRSMRSVGECVLATGNLDAIGAKLGQEALARAITEGWILGCYEYRGARSGPVTSRPGQLVIAPGELASKVRREFRAGVKLGSAVAAAVNQARELANEPPNDLYPEVLARRARAIARRAGLRVRVLALRDLERERMGGILAVGRGSERTPRLIVLEHRPRRKRSKTLVLVGKAVTFDTGGISLKPGAGMQDMKFDMAGGAAVLAAMEAIATLDLPLNVVGLIPSAENMPDGNAYRPGDIVKTASGKSVEIVNTDAEGRVLLADALHYARRFDPDAVVDVATLTGAVVVALGHHISGLMTNDQALGERIRRTAAAAGERFWELPLHVEAHEAIKSKVADLKNSGGREAGAISAGAFLASFIDGVPWAHLDIAGTGWSSRAHGYHAGGATGVAVRSLVELARDFPNP